MLDENSTTLDQLDARFSGIWSSTTLYTAEVREKRKEIDEAIAGLQSDSSKLYDVIASLQPIGEMFNMGKKTKKHLARLLEQMQKELDANKLKETDKMIIKDLYL